MPMPFFWFFVPLFFVFIVAITFFAWDNYAIHKVEPRRIPESSGAHDTLMSHWQAPA